MKLNCKLCTVNDAQSVEYTTTDPQKTSPGDSVPDQLLFATPEPTRKSPPEKSHPLDGPLPSEPLPPFHEPQPTLVSSGPPFSSGSPPPEGAFLNGPQPGSPSNGPLPFGQFSNGPRPFGQFLDGPLFEQPFSNVQQGPLFNGPLPSRQYSNRPLPERPLFTEPPPLGPPSTNTAAEDQTTSQKKRCSVKFITIHVI